MTIDSTSSATAWAGACQPAAPRAEGTAPAVGEWQGQSALLHANSAAYERLARVAGERWRSGDAEAALAAVSRAAGFASAFHPGRFADGAIENIALEIGRSSAGAPLASRQRRSPSSKRRVLHVVTQVCDIGGHTRMLYHWMRNDRASTHSIAVVQQEGRAVPVWLARITHGAGGSLHVCDRHSTRQARAAQVRRLAQEQADLVVLHHDGHDVIPSVAFATDQGPPVAVLNHADHVFWLGSSVADAVIDLRSAASVHSRERRFAPRGALLPIPLGDAPLALTRAGARDQLGIPHEQRVLLSIGRKLKFRPCGRHDFMNTAAKILERDTAAHLYIVGASEPDITPYLRAPCHARIHFVGQVADPTPYLAAADVYLESFPFGSNTALLEAGLAGLPVVPAYAPLFPLLVAGNDSLLDLALNPPSEEAYIERVGELARDESARAEFGARLRDRVRRDHVGDGWLEHLARLYRDTDSLRHRAAVIPTATCSAGDEDLGLSLWKVMADGKTNHRAGSSLDPLALLRHAAFVAKDAGDYANARALAARAVWINPGDRASWRLLGASALGAWGPVARSWLNRAAAAAEP